MKKFITEREGQIEFFEKFNIDWKNNSVLIDNTDGIWNGNILEFKINISNINKVLSQAIKYLSKMRVKGESIPSNIILVSLNDYIAYIFKSKDYFKEIHQIYFGASSKNNEDFIVKSDPVKIQFEKQDGLLELTKYFMEKNYLSIDLDENCIVGWAERYYRENPKATKGSFLGDEDENGEIGEIRNPSFFKGLINPYKKRTNEKFKYLMDKLNDRINKKDLGAFYTPFAYCNKAKELVEKAISIIPKNNDYIILDRCAGTGNLEAVLSDEQLSHCVLSTYEYYEYKVLCERLGEKVRAIIPPFEMEDTYDKGLVKCADAMSEEYLNNDIIKSFLDNENCSVIMLENPPYRDDTSGMTGIKSKGKKLKSFVLEKMKEEKVSKTNEIANRFIWSAFKYYLRQKTDSYILFSPIKYWKTDKLINKKFIKGYLFNKKYFHSASPSAITCILWQNIDKKIDELNLDVMDINQDVAVMQDVITAKRVNNEITKIFDKENNFSNKIKYACKTNGQVIENEKGSFNDDTILGYFVGRGFGISNPNLNFNLVRLKFEDEHGFYITKENYYNKLVILSIKHYLMFCRNWSEIEFICCSTDKGKEYEKDNKLLQNCFIFACLDYYNKCLSFEIDGKVIINELCFEKNTIAYNKLKTLKLNKDEKFLIDLYEKTLQEAKKTKEYNEKFTYGIYQISNELNTWYKDDNDNKIYNYPELNGYLETLRKKTDKFFDKYIKDKLYEYELIK